MTKNLWQYPNDTNKALSIMAGYFEAAEWTEDLKSESVDIDSWNATYEDCHLFVQKILASEEYKKKTFIVNWDSQELMNRMGNDLWLTRNGHGAGFWDRPEFWGDCADLFSDFARSMGEKYAYVENGKLFFE